MTTANSGLLFNVSCRVWYSFYVTRFTLNWLTSMAYIEVHFHTSMIPGTTTCTVQYAMYKTCTYSTERYSTTRPGEMKTLAVYFLLYQ